MKDSQMSIASTRNLETLEESFCQMDFHRKQYSLPSMDYLIEKKNLVSQINESASQRVVERLNNSIQQHNSYIKLVSKSAKKMKSKPTKRKLQKRQSVIERDLQENSHLKGSWRDLEVQWGPPFREYACMVEFGQVYIMGGFGNSIYNDFYSLELNYYKWTKYPPVFGRYGHTMTVAAGCIFVIGGEAIINRAKQLIQDISKFDGSGWSTVKISGVFQARKFHASTTFNSQIIVVGGENQGRKLLSETILLDPYSGKMHSINYAPFKGLKHHAMTETRDGVYMYGGVNQNGEAFGDLYLFTSADYWKQVQTTGQQPPKLCMHTLMYYQPFLILYGGKNEERFTRYLTEIYAMKQNVWSRIEQDGEIPKGRAGHCACIYDDSMIIFGGFNLDGYLNNQVQIMDFKRVVQFHAPKLVLPEIRKSQLQIQHAGRRSLLL